MSDQKDSRFDRPVLNGLVALIAVALGVGLILALVALVGSSFLGLGDSRKSSADSSVVRDSMYLPSPAETESESAPRLTLNTETPDDDASSSGNATDATDETEDPEFEETESEETEETDAGEGEISLQAVENSVASGERIYFSGVYPGGEGAILWMQRFTDGDWVDFPASVGVTNGTFSSYIFSGVSGLNRFRLIDRDTGITSNEIRIQIG